ncbi:MAG: hypothetical protein IJU70_06445 [Lentisphaeria bacterium]|nr:hypothetical protein [Lentisphaeria bacterium]
MKALYTLCLLALFGLLTGCKTAETLAAGITTKNVSGNGTVIDSRIGIDPDTKIPGLKTVFISGDFATVKAGTNQVSYREESSASIWNASSVTKKRFLAITLADSGDVPGAIRAVAEVFREASTPPAPAAEPAPAETQPARSAENKPAQPAPAAK